MTPRIPADRLLFRAREVAAMLGEPETEIRRLMRERTVDVVHLVGARRIPRAEVLRLLAEKKAGRG